MANLNKISFDWAAPAQTVNGGNAFWTARNFGASVIDFYGWEFVFNQNADLYCAVLITNAWTLSPPKIILELASADTTPGHTATFVVSDKVTSSLNPNIGSFTAAPSQLYTSTGVAYANSELVFPVQSAVVVGELLLCKVHQAAGGTNTANVIMTAVPKVQIQ